MIKKELAAGRQNIFLVRSWEKYGRYWKTGTFWILWPFWILGLSLALAFTVVLFRWPGFTYTRDGVERYITGPLPVYLINVVEALAKKLPWPEVAVAIHAVYDFVRAVVLRVSELLAVLVLVGLPFYVTTFFVWAGTRHIVRWLDRRLAGAKADPDSLDWELPEEEEGPEPEPVRAG